MADLQYGTIRIPYATIFERRMVPDPPQPCGTAVKGEAVYKVMGRIPELAGCRATGAVRGKMKYTHTPVYVWLCRHHAR